MSGEDKGNGGRESDGHEERNDVRHAGSTVARFTATEAGIAVDKLGVEQLKAWVAAATQPPGCIAATKCRGPTRISSSMRP